jgi:hypothetical protein
MEYQKLHDKLNYLENKICEMRSKLERKREEKRRYFEREARECEKMRLKEPAGAPTSANNPLKEVVSQVSCKKNLKPLAFDPYSPCHNIYYVSEIVRAYREENSLAREHLVSSLQFLRMLSRNRVQPRQEPPSREAKFPKKPAHQGTTP